MISIINSFIKKIVEQTAYLIVANTKNSRAKIVNYKNCFNKKQKIIGAFSVTRYTIIHRLNPGEYFFKLREDDHCLPFYVP